MDTYELPQEPLSLCDICQAIPFKTIQENPETELKQVNLGTFAKLSQRLSCPFCRLIFEFMRFVARVTGDTMDKLQKFPFDLLAEWKGHCFEIISVSMELRFTTGPCSRLGRLVNPDPISVERITSLIHECDSSHQCLLAISEEDAARMPALRVVDVHKMCITYISPREPYVALSYVWGGVSAARLVRANLEELLKPHGLDNCQDGIPSTIRDAMKLVRMMNMRYLWVDALCLVQDDPEDMADGTGVMSLIYENAYLTIIAAEGLHANYGLPGVSAREISQITAEVLPGVQLVVICRVGALIHGMYYDTRAWTFQEFHISRRKLIFINGLVYYQCMTSFWGEDREEQPLYPDFWSLMLDPINPKRTLKTYANLLEAYATRQATYQRDIVNAVASVYRKILGRSCGGHLFGTSAVAFEWFMAFHTYTENYVYFERREDLPSWTWVGWRGRLEWNLPYEDHEILAWIAENTWIIWHIRDPTGTLKPIWEVAATGQHTSTIPVEETLTRRIANVGKFSADVLPTQPSREIPPALEHRKWDLLQFWTASSTFRLYRDRGTEEYLASLEFSEWKVGLEVFDRDDKYSGFIYVDEESSQDSHDAVEIIVISEACRVMSFDYAFIHGGPWAKIEGDGDGLWYDALYIADTASGTAVRKGFGQIYVREAITVSPDSPWVWKEFILG